MRTKIDDTLELMKEIDKLNDFELNNYFATNWLLADIAKSLAIIADSLATLANDKEVTE